jgi:uncharacterized protein (TIGR00288 family)
VTAQQTQRSTGSSSTQAAQGDVALLIDYENLQVSLKRHFEVTTPKMSLIIQEAQDHGRLVLARAYAPWTSPDLSIDAENLYRQGIELVYVPTRKNSADVRMAVDAVEACSRASNISTYVIVTGDGDLIHPLNYLRQQGRTVVVIGVDAAMSRLLSAAADAVLLYERDLDPSVRQPDQSRSQQQRPGFSVQQKPALAPTSKEYPPAEEAFRLVQDALARRGNGEPVLFQELGHWLSQDHNLKPRVWYGVPFSTFLDAAQQAGNVQLTTSGGNSYATLPASVDADDALLDDDMSDESPEGDSDDGSTVRLESLRAEERTALFEALQELQASKRQSYTSFRLILNHLVSNSILPRLSEWQVRRLINDLADRNPPILVRGQKTGKTPGGRSYTFSTFSLTEDRRVLKQAEQGEE